MQTAEDLPVKKRIFVQRDFSDGMVVKFQSKFPVELDNRVSFKVGVGY